MNASQISFAIIRAVHFTACLLALGTAAFDQLIAARASEPAKPLMRQIWRPVYRHLVWSALAIALITGAVWLLFVVADLNDVPLSHAFIGSNFMRVWRLTHFGRLAEGRLIVLLVAGLGFVIAERSPALEKIGRAIGLLASAGLVATLAWTGHGQMGVGGAWHIWADAAHLLIAGVWPIGLLPLVMVLAGARGSVDPAKPGMIGQIATRFSSLALLSVILLTATGLANAWSLLAGPADLYRTPYGQVLSIKLILFAGMVAIGAANLLRLKPRLARQDESEITAKKLQRNVLIELVLAGLLMLAVGALGMLPPPACCVGW